MRYYFHSDDTVLVRIFFLMLFALSLFLNLSADADESDTGETLLLPATPVDRVIPADMEATITPDSWHLSLPDNEATSVKLYYVPQPKAVRCASDKKEIPFSYNEGILSLQSAKEECSTLVVQWPESRWTETIQKFVGEDNGIAPLVDGVFFTGSSTARMWDVKKFFPGINTLNRGFGGSQYWDLVCFAEPILGEHRPETIVIYSGDNDVSAGKSPEWIVADCAVAIKRFRQLTPESRIVILAAKPSGSRWDLYPVMQQANELIEKHVANINNVFYLDLGPLLLDAAGKPDDSCFLKDKLHINDKGYQRWSDVLTTFLNSLDK